MRFLSADVRFESRWIMVLVGLFFLLSGALATLMLLMGAPSFWYVPCAVLWAASGFVWMLRPSLAAGLIAFPVLAIAALVVPMLLNVKQTDSWDRLLLLCVAVALAVIAAAFRRKET